MKSKSRYRSRNRHSDRETLGTSSGRVERYSYRKGTQPEAVATERAARDKRTTSKKRLLLIVGIIAIVAVCVIELPLGSKPKIVVLGNGNPASTSQTSSYQAASEQIIGSKLSYRTKLTFDKDQFRRELMSRFPGVAGVQVDFSLFSFTPTVEISLEKPVLTIATAKGSYLVGLNGYILAPAKDSSGSLKTLPLVEDTSAAKASGRVLPASYVSFIVGVARQLGANGVKVSKVTLPNGSAEADVYVAGATYYAKFNLMGDYQEQAGAYIATSRYLVKQGITPASYIDLRVPGKAYYK